MSAGEDEGLAAGPGVDDRTAAAGVALRVFHPQADAGGEHCRVAGRPLLRSGGRIDHRDDGHAWPAVAGHSVISRRRGTRYSGSGSRRHCQHRVGIGGRTAQAAKLFQAADARRSDYAARFLTVDDHHEARNALDSEAIGQVAILIDVHPANRVPLGGKLIDGGHHRTAGAAPVGIEVQEHGIAGTAAGDRHGDQRRRQRKHRILPYWAAARGSPLGSS